MTYKDLIFFGTFRKSAAMQIVCDPMRIELHALYSNNRIRRKGRRLYATRSNYAPFSIQAKWSPILLTTSLVPQGTYLGFPSNYVPR